MTRVIGSLLVAGSLVAALSAQQSPSGLPTFRAGVDVVRLDVSVLDKNRKPVTGLTAADFTVFEDGKARPIVSFTPVDLPGAAPDQTETAAWTRDVAPDITTNAVAPEGRLVVIMFDWSIRGGDRLLARRIARTAIDDLGPNDLAAIVFSDPRANAAAKQDFTADHARLIAAINRPMTVPDGYPALVDPEGYESNDCGCRLCVMDAVTGIANTLRDVTGRRKVLLFIGTFFQGFELQTPAPGGKPTPQGRSPFIAYYNGGIIPTASGVYEGQCSGQLNESLDKMKRAAGLANLRIDTFDPSGLTAPLDDPFPKNIPKRLADLHIMPDATGGRTVVATNAPESLVPDVLDESRSYYLVGFERGSTANDGQLHALRVKVNRPDVIVQTRSGYVATAAFAAAESPASGPITRAIDRVLPESGLPLVAAVAAFAPTASAGRASVAVIVGVHESPAAAPSSQPASAGARAAQRHVVVALFDTNGRSLAKAEQTVTTTPRDTSGADAPFEVLSILPAAPGHYEIRAAVDGAPDDRGSVYTFVDVPNFAKELLSMSGILVHAVPAVAVSMPVPVKGVLPTVPTARRTFGANEQVTASLRVYERAGGTPASVTITSRIVNAQDETVFSRSETIGADQFLGARGPDYAVELPVRGLAPGDYLLMIDATAGAHTVHRDVRFARSAAVDPR